MARRPLVPPHVAWPAAIVALLLSSVGVGITAVFAARSDGGAEIVEDAFAGTRADTLAALDRSRALGWTLTVEAMAVEPMDADSLPATSGAGGTRALRLIVTGADGARVTGLTGVATVSRPQHARPLATRPLVPLGGGAYRIDAPTTGAGLYDVTVDLRRAGGARFLDRARLTLR